MGKYQCNVYFSKTEADWLLILLICRHVIACHNTLLSIIILVVQVD